MRRFVIIGQKATASDDFLLEDVPGTSGRLDVLLRCVRAALLFSHGVRRDVVVYLVLLGGSHAPRVLRVDGGAAKFVRPDERSLATLARKALATGHDRRTGEFVDARQGISVMSGGLEGAIGDLAAATPYILDEGAPDIRELADLGRNDSAFFLGDHLGFGETTRAQLAAIGARPISVGPMSLHAEDVIAIVSNELDRRGGRST
jgi:tRNA (pseudouridine54-N1)-methyltransferase